MPSTKKNGILNLVGSIRTGGSTLKSVEIVRDKLGCEFMTVCCPSNEIHLAQSLYRDAKIIPWDLERIPFSVRPLRPRNADPSTLAFIESFYAQLARQYISSQHNRKMILEIDPSNQFEWTICKWRPDIDILCTDSLENSNQSERISIPSFNNFLGYNDWLAFGGKASMEAYLERIVHLNTYIRRGFQTVPETFLKWTLEHKTRHKINWLKLYAIVRRNEKTLPTVYFHPNDPNDDKSMIRKFNSLGVTCDETNFKNKSTKLRNSIGLTLDFLRGISMEYEIKKLKKSSIGSNGKTRSYQTVG